MPRANRFSLPVRSAVPPNIHTWLAYFLHMHAQDNLHHSARTTFYPATPTIGLFESRPGTDVPCPISSKLGEFKE